MTDQTTTSDHGLLVSPPPMHRRLVAMFYDFCFGGILAGIVAFVLAYLLNNKGITIPADSGLSYSIFGIEMLVGFLYFQWFCLHKGKSLGMSVWKMRIANLSGEHVTYTQVLLRYVSLLLILLSGFLLGHKILTYSATASIGIALIFLAASLAWSVVNSKRLVLHEVISRTQLIDTR